MSDLLVQDVTVRFGGLSAVSSVSLEVPAGGFVGLIGPNGAGKTTLFNAVSGFTAPSRGRILFGGRDIAGFSPSARAALGIGRTFQRLELFSRMSVFENLLVAVEAAESGLGMAADLLRLPQRRKEVARCSGIAAQMLSMMGLDWARDRRASDLPVGIARKLELGRALCAKPRLLLLDEASSGLDPSETAALGRLLRTINAELGTGILLVEHDVDLVMDVSERIYVLDFGSLIAQGTAAEVGADPAVRTAYLGAEDDEAAASPA